MFGFYVVYSYPHPKLAAYYSKLEDDSRLKRPQPMGRRKVSSTFIGIGFVYGEMNINKHFISCVLKFTICRE